MQKVDRQPESQDRLLVLAYSALVSIALSIALALATYLFSVKRAAVDTANLRADVLEIKREMANRRDLQTVHDSLRRLEADLQKLNDQIQRTR